MLVYFLNTTYTFTVLFVRPVTVSLGLVIFLLTHSNHANLLGYRSRSITYKKHPRLAGFPLSLQVPQHSEPVAEQKGHVGGVGEGGLGEGGEGLGGGVVGEGGGGLGEGGGGDGVVLTQDPLFRFPVHSQFAA